MNERKTMTIAIDMSTDKLQLKLKAVAKHCEALGKELDAIDNAWQCDCGSYDYSDHTYPSGSLAKRICDKCKESYVVPNDDLPTRLEGSD